MQSAVLLLAAWLSQAAIAQGIYGDVNGDGEVNIADANEVVKVILGDEIPTPPDDESDTVAVTVFDTKVASRRYYRIPAIVQLQDGRLLAVGDDRHRASTSWARPAMTAAGRGATPS